VTETRVELCISYLPKNKAIAAGPNHVSKGTKLPEYASGASPIRRRHSITGVSSWGPKEVRRGVSDLQQPVFW
jgi:hypothetical protein